MAGRTKSLIGTVVSDKMEKTVVVRVESTTRHRLYRKILRRSKRYMAHDDRLEAKEGDTVRILEAHPYSRHKRWRVAEIVKRGDVAEIAPREIDSEYIERPRERAEQPEDVSQAEPALLTEEAPATEGEAAGDADEGEPEAAGEEPEAAAEADAGAAEAAVEEPEASEPEATPDADGGAAEAAGEEPKAELAEAGEPEATPDTDEGEAEPTAEEETASSPEEDATSDDEERAET